MATVMATTNVSMSPRLATLGAVVLGILALMGSTFFVFPQTVVAGEPTSSATTEAPKADPNVLEMAGNVLGNFSLSPIIGISYIVLTLAGFILGLVGWLFNISVAYLVFDFGKYFGNSGGLLVGWGVLRDFGNILLLFGFVSIGIQTILNINHFSVGKALPRLIIFAVLLNFSLFVTEAIIDSTNAVASVLYSETRAGSCVGTATECAINNGIASNILNAAGIGTVLGNLNLGGKALDLLSNPIQKVVGFLGLALFVTTASVVLLAGAVLLISRAVVLAFLMITSPIGFAGMAIPQLNSFANMWWKSLINNALFAPAYLLLILVSLKIMVGFSTVNGKTADLYAAVTNGTGNDAGGLLIFGLMIGFLMASLIAARKFGIAGADFVINSAAALTYGTLARGTNFVVGGIATAAAKHLERYGVEKNSRLARALSSRVLRPIANSNLDLRKFGAGAILKAVGATSGAKEAEHALFKDTSDIYNDFKSGNQGKENENAIKRRVKADALENNLRAADHGGTSLPPESKQALASMSAKALEELHATQEGSSTIAKNVSSDQFDGLMKSENLTERVKSDLKTARFEDLTKEANEKNVAAATAALRNMSKSDLENIPYRTLMSDTVLEALNDKQREDLIGSDKRTPEERDKIKAWAPTSLFEARFRSAPNKAAFVRNPVNGLGKLKPAQVASLDTSILTNPAIAQNLSVSMLNEIAKNNRLDVSQIAQIAGEIRRSKRPGDPVFEHITTGPASGFWN